MNYILVAASSESGEFTDLANVARAFSHVVDACKRVNKEEILSPLTITLGDEFQGIVKVRRVSFTGSLPGLRKIDGKRRKKFT